MEIEGRNIYIYIYIQLKKLKVSLSNQTIKLETAVCVSWENTEKKVNTFSLLSPNKEKQKISKSLYEHKKLVYFIQSLSLSLPHTHTRSKLFLRRKIRFDRMQPCTGSVDRRGVPGAHQDGRQPQTKWRRQPYHKCWVRYSIIFIVLLNHLYYN